MILEKLHSLKYSQISKRIHAERSIKTFYSSVMETFRYQFHRNGEIFVCRSLFLWISIWRCHAPMSNAKREHERVGTRAHSRTHINTLLVHNFTMNIVIMSLVISFTHEHFSLIHFNAEKQKTACTLAHTLHYSTICSRYCFIHVVIVYCYYH